MGPQYLGKNLKFKSLGRILPESKVVRWANAQFCKDHALTSLISPPFFYISPFKNTSNQGTEIRGKFTFHWMSFCPLSLGLHTTYALTIQKLSALKKNNKYKFERN